MNQTTQNPSHLIDLVSQELGGAVLFANDDFFASKDNLILTSEAVWKEDAFTDRGKWMDGWESRRKRTQGHDYCFIKLGLPGLIRKILVDTAFFTGNYPDSCSIDGCVMSSNATPEELENATWFSLVEDSKLEGGSKNWFDVSNEGKVTHLRFNIFPDGGVARLRVFGEVLPALNRWISLGQIDLAAMTQGGKTVAQSDMYFGLASNLLKPTRALNMGDGWETKRSRGKGHVDWCIIELAALGRIEYVEIDTNHFKGNFPDRCCLEVAQDWDGEQTQWQPLLDEVKLQAHTSHVFESELHTVENIKFVRLKIFPDGGISRLRLFGTPSRQGWEKVTVRDLNTTNTQSAKTQFLSTCGSQKWAAAMTEARPFSDFSAVVETAGSVFETLDESDWLEAFRAHPRIGGKKTQDNVTRKSLIWSTREQLEIAAASVESLSKLEEMNERYFEKHGFIFIVFASGKSATQTLEILESRLENDTKTEIKNAAIEQEKITAVRLQKWMRQ